MNAWTPPPSDATLTDAPLCGDDAAMTDRQLWLCGRLAELGLSLVEAIERQAQAQAMSQPAPSPTPGGQPAPGQPSPQPPEPPAPVFAGDLALAYARASRAVRMSIALQARLMAERRAAAVETARESRMAAVRDRPARRARIDRLVERLVVDAHEHDDEAVERCLSEAAERLDDTDVFGDVLSRPVSETIDLICRELGLSPDWPALAREAWAAEEIAAGAAGAPLRALAAKRAAARPPPPPPRPPRPSPASLSRSAGAAPRPSPGSRSAPQAGSP